MFKGLKRRFKSHTTEVREIQDGVDVISRRQAEQQESEMTDLRGREIQDGFDLVRQKLEEQHSREMADLRASEYFAPPVYCDSALTLAQRSLTN
jgi:hypothetical protein